MAKIINSDKNFKVIELSLSDCIKLGGLGICDHCNTAIDKGYYVAVLDNVLCEKCYKSWHDRAENYPEDRRVEERIFNRMKKMIKDTVCDLEKQQEEPLSPAEPHIDWEQRRYELAIQAMVAMIDNKRISNAVYIAVSAVEMADCMIKELKGGKI